MAISLASEWTSRDFTNRFTIGGDLGENYHGPLPGFTAEVPHASNEPFIDKRCSKRSSFLVKKAYQPLLRCVLQDVKNDTF